MPLRDFPTLPENLNFDPKTLIVVPNESTTQIEINEGPPTIIDNLQTKQGRNKDYAYRTKFYWSIFL